MEREGLATLDDARAMMAPRDEMKRRRGVDRVRTLADIVLQNNGAISDLHRQLDDVVVSVD